MRNNLLRFTKISWKLTFVYALIFSLVLVLLSAAVLYGVKFYLVQQSINQVETSSRATERWILQAKASNIGLADPKLLSEAQADSEIEVQVADPSGKVVNTSDPSYRGRLDISYKLGRTWLTEPAGLHLVVRNTAVASGGRIVAYLQVIRNMKREYAFVDLLFILLAATDFAGILISLMAGYLISRRILTPIDNITRTAKKISVTDLNSRIEVGGADDELTRLAVTFNDMLGRLKLSFEQQENFVSDASHELRTPISVIQGYINLMDRWGKDDRKVLQESIEAIKNEAANMAELVERLLFLARGDTGTIRLNRESIELNGLVEEIIKESRLIAPEHRLSSDVDGRLQVSADRKLIKQMLRALLDNSIKFTAPGGDIGVYARGDTDSVVITVRDTGIGIPAEELDKIFQRFYKVDKARAQEKGGSGIGLSIVKWIVDVHGGNIGVESEPGKGTVVRVTLPI